ncbi:nitroreductase family protein [Bacillus spongiae]|uniref:Nitroreductase family protein n=1 Tax=Bacillus spongiae TaxID=2683610 RepID=A0ABU8HIB8_9BACI
MNKTQTTLDIFQQKQDTFYADAMQDKILDERTIHDISKFHQSTTWHFPFHFGLDDRTLEWMDLVENTDVLPENVEDEIIFDDDANHEHDYKSTRHFNLDEGLSIQQLGEVLKCAFSRNSFRGSKPYPSAGALYPVIPLLYILNDKAVENGGVAGCYVFDSTNHKLMLIKSFNEEDQEKVRRNLCQNEDLYSNLAVGYALDIKRAITKYKKRGYRHGLIEVGLMAQSFRNSINRFQDMGECCWSGFNDNALSHLSGLNPKLAPLIMMQWFGKTR